MQIFTYFFCKKNYKNLLLLISLAILSPALPAQVDNSALVLPPEVQAGKEKNLYFRLMNLNFMRNNEYFTPIVQGQTFFGYQLAPTLIYLPTPHIEVEAGVFLRHDFGRQDFAQIQPIFSFRYKKNKTSITFGNLHSSLSHGLIEPLYSFERVLTHYLENGFQIKHKSRVWDIDAWVDWQQVAYPRGNQQEHIWAGANINLRIAPCPKGEIKTDTSFCSGLSVSLQGTTFHQGGQDLNLPTPLPATNSFQVATGLRYATSKWLAEAYYVRTTREIYADSLTTVRAGNGLYAQVGKKWGKKNDLQTVVSYWQGYGVDNVLGGDLYKSFPTYTAGKVQMSRRLVMLRLSKVWTLAENITLTARLEPYYDFVSQRLEQVQMLFITFRPTFRVAGK